MIANQNGNEPAKNGNEPAKNGNELLQNGNESKETLLRITYKEEMVLKVIRQGDVHTIAQISNETGISKRTVSRVLDALVHKALIQREGSDTKGKWTVKS